EIRAERPIGPSVSDLAVDFVEAGDRLRNVPGREKGRTAGSRQRGDAPRRSVTRAARVIIFPKTDVEDDRAPRRAHATVEIDFSSSVIGKLDALAGDAGVELPVRIDVVARLEVGRDRWMMRRLRDTAENIIAHQRAAEGDVPWARRRGGSHSWSLGWHVCGQRGHSSTRNRPRRHNRQPNFFY